MISWGLNFGGLYIASLYCSRKKFDVHYASICSVLKEKNRIFKTDSCSLGNLSCKSLINYPQPLLVWLSPICMFCCCCLFLLLLLFFFFFIWMWVTWATTSLVADYYNVFNVFCGILAFVVCSENWNPRIMLRFQQSEIGSHFEARNALYEMIVLLFCFCSFFFFFTFFFFSFFFPCFVFVLFLLGIFFFIFFFRPLNWV